jgi:hypothetical protein
MTALTAISLEMKLEEFTLTSNLYLPFVCLPLKLLPLESQSFAFVL